LAGAILCIWIEALPQISRRCRLLKAYYLENIYFYKTRALEAGLASQEG
jgi:hypothetical protein